MTPPANKSLAFPEYGESRGTAAVASAVLVGLLALAIARTTLNEVPFRLPPLQEAGAYDPQPPSQTMHYSGSLLRVVSATVILALAAAWAISAALARRPLQLRHPVFALWTALLAICLFASASQAADKRAGFDTALEQTSLLVAAFVAMQVVRTAWQRRLVVLAVAGLAVMLGFKGIYQVAVEVPDRVGDFLASKDRILAARNMAPGSPEALMFESRVRESTTTGWFGLANIYASLLIPGVLAMAGLTVDKWRVARSQRGVQAAKRGDVPLPLLAAIVTTALAIAPLAAWVLTRSMAGVASGMAAGAIFALLAMRAPWAARHRRALLAAAIVALAAGAAALVATGLLRGQLPHRSLQVRWLYWSASADMVRERPVEGVGPGNFPDAYLRHRRPGAEEGVKNPHNVVSQSLSEYGLPGGLVYLALLGFVLVKLTARSQSRETVGAPAIYVALATVFMLAIAWRASVTHYPGMVSFLFDNFIPIVGLGVGVLAAAWFGLGHTGTGQTRWAEIGLACGLAGFALHNLTDFALFQPGAAMIFWLAGGALVAEKAGRQWTLSRPVALGVAFLLLAVATAAAVGIVRPDWRKSAAIGQTAQCIATGQPRELCEGKLVEAVKADPLDAAPAAELAQLYEASAAFAEQNDQAEQALGQAYLYSHLAQQRQPLSPQYEEMFLHALASQLDPTLSLARWDRSPAEAPGEWRGPGAPTPWHLSRKAEHHYRRGEFEQTEQLLGQAISMTDQPGLLLDHAGDVQYRLGRPEAARDYWLAFLQTRLEDLKERWAPLAANGPALMNHLNSQSSRMHIRMAELAWQAGQPTLALAEVEAALAADAALTSDSLVRLADWEKQRLEIVRVKCESVSGPAK